MSTDLDQAQQYIDRARSNEKHYAKRADERCAFLCGNAGIDAVSAAISSESGNSGQLQSDLKNFSAGFEACKPLNFNKYGSDEILIEEFCESMIQSGISYSRRKNSPLMLMYEYHNSEYLGAAHGICSIYHMILNSSWFDYSASGQHHDLIKSSTDGFLAELVWKKGLLRKGPSICHGVAGNGYVFLLLYQLTKDSVYLYRASKFAEFLSDRNFRRDARTPDRPFSLYEGLAGTVCFLADLLEPEKAPFPFMEVY
ncbi:LanC-like protein 3 homolog [Sergentomyia squamirostris]